jgi:two-component system sensor histidine kinase/response regulator
VTCAFVWWSASVFERRANEALGSWERLEASAGRQDRLHDSLQRNIGYGGFIHTFKNWVLRRDEALVPQLRAQLDEQERILQAFRASSDLAPEDLRDLDRLEAVLDAYRSRLVWSLAPENRSLPPAELDALVRVDDGPAIAAIAGLAERHAARRAAQVLALRTDLFRAELFARVRYPVVAVLVLGFGLVLVQLRRRGRLNERLEELRAHAEQLFDQSPMALVLMDSEGIIRRANRAVGHLGGRSPAALIGQSVETFLPPRLLDAHREERRRLVHEGVGARSDTVAMTVLNAAGEEIPVEANLGRTRLGSEELVLAAVRDVRAQRAAQQAMEEARRSAEAANQAKSSFLANMSHEIRTPMNAILGMLHVTLQRSLPSEVRGEVETAVQAAESLLGIISDVLDYSKIEAGHLELAPEPTALAALLDETFDIIRAVAARKDVRLALRLRGAVPIALRVDALRLQQVLVNLLNNAVKFSDEGTVALTVEPAGEHRLALIVEDQGIGMDADTLAALFEPFQQADASISRRFGGTGLGLTIAHRIVAAMGGEIAVRSTPGEGSTFRVEIPVEVLQAEALPAEVRRRALLGVWPADPAGGSRPCVLLAGGEAWAEGWIARLLRDAGCLVVRHGDPLGATRELVERGREGVALVVADGTEPWTHGLVRAWSRVGGEADRFVLEVPPSDRPTAPTVGAVLPLALPQPLSLRNLAGVLGRLRRAPEATECPSAERSAEEDTLPLRGLSVLIAEDNAVNRRVARALVESQGGTASTVEDGAEALRVLGERPDAFDLVLMDMQMPTMDGLEATRRIRACPALADLPIVALTANASVEDRAACRAAGMDAYLSKPVRIASLREVVLSATGPGRSRATA